MSSKKYDVVVVGLGPVGAALANLLGNHGLKVLAIDKATQIFAAPRAIALDNEALRILQLCGLAEDAFEKVVIPVVKMHSPYFGQYSRINSAGAIDGHPKLVTFFQPELEAALRKRLESLASVTVALGVELLSFSEQTNSVSLEVTTADGNTEQVTATYIVGADGANSTIRRMIGLEFQGQTYAEDWLVVDAFGAQRPIDHVEFICNPSRPAPHMPAPGGRQRWEFKLQPGESREHMEQPQVIAKLLEPWEPGAKLQIERVAVYRFHARVAERFSAGRAFLVGDAAHITPPFVGQGLVAGLRDVANLAWKLAWVVRGQAKPGILDSYSIERRPHAKAIIDLAKLMGKLVMPANPLRAYITHGIVTALSRLPRLKRLMEDGEVKPANVFRKGLFVPHNFKSRLRRGGQVPQAWVRGAAPPAQPVLSDSAIGNGLAMVGYGVDPQQLVDTESAARWRAQGGSFVQINPRGQQTQSLFGTASWEDFTGDLIPERVPFGWIAITRPDMTVMHDGPAADARQLMGTALGLLQAPTARAGNLVAAM